MNDNYKLAFAEVYQIIQNSEKEIQEDIPEKLKKYILENMDKNHKIELDTNKNILEQNIMEETKDILAVIYKYYLCTEQEKNELIQQELEIQIKVEQEKKQKYNQNDLFKNKENRQGEFHLVKYIEPKWYKKIYNKILEIFNIRKW